MIPSPKLLIFAHLSLWDLPHLCPLSKCVDAMFDLLERYLSPAIPGELMTARTKGGNKLHIWSYRKTSDFRHFIDR